VPASGRDIVLVEGGIAPLSWVVADAGLRAGAAACAPMNRSSAVLTCSASVHGIECGLPLTVTSWTSLTEAGTRLPGLLKRHRLARVALHHEHRHVDLAQVGAKAGHPRRNAAADDAAISTTGSPNRGPRRTGRSTPSSPRRR